MKYLKRAMSTIGILLVVVGFSNELSAMLQYIGNFIGITKEQVCLLIGFIDLLALTVVNCIDHMTKERRKNRQMEESISDLERKLFGKVITFDYCYEKRAPKTETVHAAIEEVAATSMSEQELKELKYQRALARMEELRKKAPKAPKKKKKARIPKKSTPSFKERVGGIRRAS